MNAFDRRIARLLQAAEQARVEMSKYEPFVELRIFSFMENTAAVIYYPKGLYGSTVKAENLTIDEALGKAREYNAPIHTNMLFCCEWSHVFIMHNDDYTKAQKDKFKADDMVIPGIRKMYELAEAENIMDLLAKVPQVLMFH